MKLDCDIFQVDPTAGVVVCTAIPSKEAYITFNSASI